MKFTRYNRPRIWVLASLVFGLVVVETRAQDVFDLVWNAREASWNVDENWNDSAGDPGFVPSGAFSEGAYISNGGTPVVDEAVADVFNLTIPNGTVDIRQGGSLSVTGSGADARDVVVGANSAIRLSGNGSFTSRGMVVAGEIALTSTDAAFQVNGDLDQQGVLQLEITSAGAPKLTASGSVLLGGTVQANFAPGLTVSPGDSFEFLSGGSVTDNGAQLELPSTFHADRGIGVLLNTSTNSAEIAVRNVPVLTVNRVTGATQLSNVVGNPLDLTGYSILSPSGLLDVAGWQSQAARGVEGWNEGSRLDVDLAESTMANPTALETGGAPLDLGNAYRPTAVHPSGEDVSLEVSLADGSVLTGFVEFMGPPNDLTLRVDPATGEAEISHQSQFIDPVDLTGYSILSASESLLVDSWNRLADNPAAGGPGWLVANPTSGALAEINPTNSKLFSNGTEFALGKIFDAEGDGVQDLVFQFTTVGGASVSTGTVLYEALGGVMLPGDCNGDGVVNAADLSCVTTVTDRDIVLASIPTLAGDLDGNGQVAFPDFLTLSNNFGQNVLDYTKGDIDLNGSIAFPDFLTLSNNFGKTPGATAAVPEPNSLALLSLATLGLLTARRRRGRSFQHQP